MTLLSILVAASTLRGRRRTVKADTLGLDTTFVLRPRSRT